MQDAHEAAPHRPRETRKGIRDAYLFCCDDGGKVWIKWAGERPQGDQRRIIQESVRKIGQWQNTDEFRVQGAH